MDAVILVGGNGTRLRPLTYAIPKALIPVLNQPLIQHLILSLRAHGVDNIVFAASASERRIEAALGDGQAFGLHLSYSYEEKPLGSGLAVKQAAQGFRRAFFVCNGDVVTDLDFGAMRRKHEEHGAILSISLSSVEDPSSFGVVALGENDRITRFVEKPPLAEAPSSWANAGSWLFEPDVLDHIPGDRMDGSLERLVFPKLIAEGRRVQGFTHDSYWMDVGTSQRYLQLHQDLLASAIPGLLPDGHTDGSLVGAGCQIDGVILGRCCLGDGVRVATGALVEDSVIWANTRVAAGATVRGSIISKDCLIGEGAIVTDSVLADGVTVKSGARLHGVRLEPNTIAG